MSDSQESVSIQSVARLPVPCHLEYAHTGCSRGRAHGRTHVVVDAPLLLGRLRRDSLDALCRERGRFWGLYGAEGADVGDEPNCTPCRERYERLVAQGVLAPHGGRKRRL